MTTTLSDIVYEELTIPQGLDSSIFIRNKRPAGIDRFTGDRVAVMLHGATYPGTSFDMAFGDVSWMDYMAQRGFDVYAPDLPGYGRSSRPSAMDQPPELNPPCSRRTEAYIATSAAIKFIMQRRGIKDINLIGWCRGGKLASFYAAQYPEDVRRLVMYAVHTTERDMVPSPERFGAYHLVTSDSIRKRWQEYCRAENLDEEMMERLFPQAHYDEWIRAIFATDPAGQGRSMRVPRGSWADEQDYLKGTRTKGLPLASTPEKVKAPVMLVRGEWDHESTQKMSEYFYGIFTEAAWRQMTAVKEATHFLFLEQKRMELYRAVHEFIEKGKPQG